MSDTLNYVGALPGTRAFCLKSMTPAQKNIAIIKVDNILDNLDDIQGLIGFKEYVKQIAHRTQVIWAVFYSIKVIIIQVKQEQLKFNFVF